MTYFVLSFFLSQHLSLLFCASFSWNQRCWTLGWMSAAWWRCAWPPLGWPYSATSRYCTPGSRCCVCVIRLLLFKQVSPGLWTTYVWLCPNPPHTHCANSACCLLWLQNMRRWRTVVIVHIFHACLTCWEPEQGAFWISWALGFGADGPG